MQNNVTNFNGCVKDVMQERADGRIWPVPLLSWLASERDASAVLPKPGEATGG